MKVDSPNQQNPEITKNKILNLKNIIKYFELFKNNNYLLFD